MRGRDVLSIADLSPDEVDTILKTALSLKRDGGGHDLLRGKTLALIFEKPSLRTRVSFDVAMQELGGHAIYLNQAEVGLGQREPVADVARVLSRYVDVIAARTYEHQTLLDLARHAGVPVINALSDEEHPCQAMADLLTILERCGTLRGIRLAFVGDGFNVAASLAEAAALAGMSFAMASPAGYSLPDADGAPDPRHRRRDRRQHRHLRNAGRRRPRRRRRLHRRLGEHGAGGLVRAAQGGVQRLHGHSRTSWRSPSPTAIFMHDLPAHRGEEVMDDVIEGPQSVVFDQAENRLHAQKAILALTTSDHVL